MSSFKLLSEAVSSLYNALVLEPKDKEDFLNKKHDNIYLTYIIEELRKGHNLDLEVSSKKEFLNSNKIRFDNYLKLKRVLEVHAKGIHSITQDELDYVFSSLDKEESTLYGKLLLGGLPKPVVKKTSTASKAKKKKVSSASSKTNTTKQGTKTSKDE